MKGDVPSGATVNVAVDPSHMVPPVGWLETPGAMHLRLTVKIAAIVESGG